MKTIQLFFYLFALFYFNSAFAQEELGNGMLFPQFENGTVVFKNGVRSAASLNYNIIQQEMLFKSSDSTIMAIANPSEIIVIIIEERRFFPVTSGGIFYEEIPAGKGSFFIQRKAIMLSQGKAAGYGGYSATSSITSYGTLYSGSGNVINLNPDEKFKLKNNNFYYLKSGKNYKKFSSAKTLGKLFKGQESKIEKFANEQSINFSSIDDVTMIVEYGFSLIN